MEWGRGRERPADDRGLSLRWLGILPWLTAFYLTASSTAEALSAWLGLALAVGSCLVPWQLWNHRRSLHGAAGEDSPVPSAVDLAKHLDRGRKYEVKVPAHLSPRLHYVIANAPAVLFAVDQDGIFTLLEGRQLERLGMRPGEVVGFSAYDFYADNPEIVGHIRAALEGEPRRWVADFRTHFFETRVLPMYDADGEVDGLFGIANDITEHKKALAALAASEAKFSLAFDATPDSIVINRLPDGTVLEVNASFERVTGYSRDEVLGKTTDQFDLWEDPEQRQYFFTQLVETGALEPFEASFRTRSGDRLTCLISARVFELEEQACVVSVVHDITYRKAAEEALRQTEGRLATAFRSSPDGISISRLPDGTYIEFNPGFEAISGYCRDEVVGKTSEQLGLWSDRDQRDRVVQRILEEGRVRNAEISLVRKDGVVRICRASGEQVELEGAPALLAIVQDITEQKAAETALRISEARFATAFRSSPDGISLTRLPSGEFIDVNPGFCAISGYDADEIIGRTTADIELWVQSEERQAIIGTIVEGGRIRDAEMSLRRKDGTVRRCRVSGEQVEMDGEPALLGVVQDITEQKEAETALRLSEEKFATAFRSSPDAIIITSTPDGEILEVNEGFSRITGYSRDEAVGSSTLVLQLWAFDAQRQSMLEQVRELGSVQDFEADFVGRDGGIRICQMSAERVMVQGRPCLLSVVRDVTERRQAEQALRLSEARLATAFRASPDAIMITRIPTGELLEVNDSFCQMTGFSRQSALGQTVVGLGLWKDDLELKRLLGELRSPGQVRNFETHFYSADGTYHPSLGAVDIIDVDGDSVLLAVVRDISDLREAEASRHRLSRMLEAISDFVAIADLDGRLLYLNGGGRRMVGLEADTDISDFALVDFLQRDEARWFREHVLAQLQTLGDWGGETVMVDQEGRRLPTLQVVTYHPGDGPDEAPFLSSIAHDISERKRMEKALVASEERFSKAFQASPDAILLTSMPVGAVLEVNQGFTRLTGYSRSAAVGRTVSQLQIWHDPMARREMLMQLSKAGQVKDLEVLIRDQADELHTCMLTGEMILLGAKPCLLLLLRDVTDKRQAEIERNTFVAELESKNAELERFTYTVSHDLKSPLVTIKGFLGMLRRDIESSNTQRAMKDIDRIQKAADTMAHLLDELLELSRVGRVVQASEDVDLGALAREVADLMAGLVVGRGVQLTVQDGLPTVFGDRHRLREVMQNLLDNALKFLGSDNPEPYIEVGCEVRGDEHVVYVEDNGLGIDPRYHEKVFDLFDRLDPDIEGTGIGLALVKRIVEFHGGRVWVESEGLGKGSRFCFVLGQVAD